MKWTDVISNTMNRSRHQGDNLDSGWNIDGSIKCDLCWRPSVIDCVKCNYRLCNYHIERRCKI